MVNYCYPLKIELKRHKINILFQIKGIEDYPFIIRFKTYFIGAGPGDPELSIEDYPFIIRFKTIAPKNNCNPKFIVLRTIHL